LFFFLAEKSGYPLLNWRKNERIGGIPYFSAKGYFNPSPTMTSFWPPLYKYRRFDPTRYFKSTNQPTNMFVENIKLISYYLTHLN
jgi:hypothetical protein